MPATLTLMQAYLSIRSKLRGIKPQEIKVKKHFTTEGTEVTEFSLLHCACGTVNINIFSLCLRALCGEQLLSY